MYARRFLPMLLMVGAVMMFMKHSRHDWLGQGEEGEQRGPLGPHGGPHSSWHGEWEKRVPPLVEKWHKQMHEQEQPAQQTPAAV